MLGAAKKAKPMAKPMPGFLGISGLPTRRVRILVQTLVFADDGQRLASAGADDGTVRLWDVATGKQKRVWPDHETGAFFFESLIRKNSPGRTHP